MSNNTDWQSEFAEAFGGEHDPFAAYEEKFLEVNRDPFDVFAEERLDSKSISSRTRDGYERVIRQWRDHMQEMGRHPACPHERHVRSFISRELGEKGNVPDTVKEKLRKLNEVFEFFQKKPVFPHGDYNPVEQAEEATSFAEWEPESKEFPQISFADLRKRVEQAKHVRDRAIIVLQLKLGLRASEVCNIRLEDLTIAHDDLQSHYLDLGAAPALADRENAIYIPHDRERNKSERPRILPLDDETRQVLLQYMLIRPDNGEPWLFLTKTGHNQLAKKNINRPWKDVFHPKYAETDDHRAVTSHYGRHRFTTYWSVKQDVSRELVQYMRGDLLGATDIDNRGAIDDYLHAYYEDIKDLYIENIFKLRI